MEWLALVIVFLSGVVATVGPPIFGGILDQRQQKKSALAQLAEQQVDTKTDAERVEDLEAQIAWLNTFVDGDKVRRLEDNYGELAAVYKSIKRDNERLRERNSMLVKKNEHLEAHNEALMRDRENIGKGVQAYANDCAAKLVEELLKQGEIQLGPNYQKPKKELGFSEGGIMRPKNIPHAPMCPCETCVKRRRVRAQIERNKKISDYYKAQEEKTKTYSEQLHQILWQNQRYNYNWFEEWHSDR